LRWSFAGRISAVFACLLVLMAGLAAAAGHVSESPWLTFVVLLLVGLPLGTWLIGRSMRPLDRILKGLACGISSFRDRDFSVRLAAKRKDELGEIARLYNQVGQTLQEERYAIRQKELLLATALNRSPAAIILVNAQDRVIYANYEARHLLMGGAKLEGCRFVEIREACPPPMREILTNDADGLFSVRHDDEHIETYHLSQRAVRLNRRRHTLILLHLITGELDRQEAKAWKKVIRVICHELNNSLAPLSSLVHSAKTIADRPGQEERIEEIFDIIHERLAHLGEFIEGYARFARLPRPRFAPVSRDHRSPRRPNRYPSPPGWRHDRVLLAPGVITVSDRGIRDLTYFVTVHPPPPNSVRIGPGWLGFAFYYCLNCRGGLDQLTFIGSAVIIPLP
jgi:PAS domain-containing protein